MIVDCFPFWKELDVLELRLRTLDSYVDKFVLVEANKTQSGLDKPFVFEENKDRFAPWLDKIVHVRVTDSPSQQMSWMMENFQRNCIRRGLDTLELRDSDIVMISDLDEIPMPEAVEQGRSMGHVFSVSMEFYAYFVNLRAKHRKWIGTVVCPFGQMPAPQALRNMKDRLPYVTGGWHFSWLGGYQRIYEKAHACIEPFDKSAIPSEDEFRAHFERFLASDEKFFLHLENLDKQETEFEMVELDDSFPLALNDPKFSTYILS